MTLFCHNLKGSVNMANFATRNLIEKSTGASKKHTTKAARKARKRNATNVFRRKSSGGMGG